jgi:peptidoglycan hydrolase-like protein with peptidoglycan-binding domain
MTCDPSQHPRAAGSAGGGRFPPKVGGSGGGSSDSPPATTTQIKDFQKKYEMPVTGKFVAKTLSAMKHPHDKPGKKTAAKKPKLKAKAKDRKPTAKKIDTADGKGTKATPGTPVKPGMKIKAGHTTIKRKAEKPVAKKQHVPRPPKKIVRKVSIRRVGKMH